MSGPHADDAPSAAPSDAALVAAIADGDAAALATLYRRHAAALLAAARSHGDRGDAGLVVQDVFLALWNDAGRFDPARGSVAGWLVAMTKTRASNARRGARRRARHEGEAARDVDDRALGRDGWPDEALLRAERRAALATALQALPREQRAAIGLAFADELTHAEVAAALRVPLGTAKTRIRAALGKLRGALGAAAAAGLLGLVIAAVVVARRERERAAVEERALVAVTSSDCVDRKLAGTQLAPAGAHGHFRHRPLAPLAVLTTSALPKLERGAYVAWIEIDGRWTRAAGLRIDDAGKGLAIAESPDIARATGRVEVTIEPSADATTPAGPVVLASEP